MEWGTLNLLQSSMCSRVQSWYLHSHLEVSKRILKQDFIAGTREQPALQFSIRASRRTGFFIFNIYMIMVCCCCCFAQIQIHI